MRRVRDKKENVAVRENRGERERRKAGREITWGDKRWDIAVAATVCMHIFLSTCSANHVGIAGHCSDLEERASAV